MKSIVVENETFKCFIKFKKIKKAVKSIARQMNNDIGKDKETIFIGILNGSFIFASDLIRHIKFSVKIDFIRVSSYKGYKSAGEINEIYGLTEDIKNKCVIIIEDIIDSGLTMKNIFDTILRQNPASVKVASLFVKPASLKENIKIDYKGFDVPDKFIIGYGLDYNGFGRNLKDVYILDN